MKSILKNIIPRNLRPLRFLEKLVRVRTEGRVQKGPFTGMLYVNRAVGSALIPKLLGIYERELSAKIEEACRSGFPLILDIGAAEGYYAVGLARRNPESRVIAFEMEETGRAAIEELAALNRVPTAMMPSTHTLETSPPLLEIHGKCHFENLEQTLVGSERSFVICDVEGYEITLLRPDRIPALRRATLLVETHEFVTRGITQMIAERFAPTHEVKCIWQEPRSPADFPFQSWVTAVMPKRFLDVAVSEWRPERMCWLWMTPKS